MSAPDQPPQRTMQSAPPTDPARPVPTDETPKDPPADDSPELEVKIPIPFIKDGEVTVSKIQLTGATVSIGIVIVIVLVLWKRLIKKKPEPEGGASARSQLAIASPGARQTHAETHVQHGLGQVHGNVTFNFNPPSPPSPEAQAIGDQIIREHQEYRRRCDVLTMQNSQLLARIESDTQAYAKHAVKALGQADENQYLGASQEYLAERAKSHYSEAARNRDAFLQAARQLVAVAYFANDHAAMKLWGDRVIEFEPDNVFVRGVLGDYAMTHESLDVALAHYTARLDATRRKRDMAPDDRDAQRDLSVSFNKIGDVRVAQGKLDEALKAFKDGLAIRQRPSEGNQ